MENQQLTDDQKRVVDEFLAERWADFEAHCEGRGENAEEVAIALQTD